MIKSNVTYKILQKHGIIEKVLNSARNMCTKSEDLVLETFGNRGLITLNRPKALNALNLSMVKKLLPTLQQWNNDKILVVVKGAGEKSFCAGGDVRAIVEANIRGEKLGEEFFRYEYSTNNLIGKFKQPYIALIDGITMGGGVGLSIHGRYRVATERTLFAMPETLIALFPDVGASYFLPKLQDKLGHFLALTGHRLKGEDVYKSGIATHFVESKDIACLEQDLLTTACNDKDVQDILKKYHKENSKKLSLTPHLGLIKECFSAETMEDIICRLMKNDSEFAQETVKTLLKMSPTSLKVTKHLLDCTEKNKLNLEECLKLEYGLACRTLQGKEFNEGKYLNIT